MYLIEEMIFVWVFVFVELIRGSPLVMPPNSVEITPQFKVFHSLSGNNFSLLVEKKFPGHFCWGFGETMKTGDIFCVEFKGGDLTPTFSDCELVGKRMPKCVSPSVRWVLKDSDLQPSESRILVTRDISLQSSWKIAPNENVFEWSYSDSPKIEPHKGKNKSFGSSTVKMNMGSLPSTPTTQIVVNSTIAQPSQAPEPPQQIIVSSAAQTQVISQPSPGVTGNSQTANPVILVQSPAVLSQPATTVARAQTIQIEPHITQLAGNSLGKTVQQFAGTVNRTFPSVAQTFQSTRQSSTFVSQPIQSNSTSPTAKVVPFVTWEMIQKIFENKNGSLARCKFTNGVCEPLVTGVGVLFSGAAFFALGCL